MTIQGNRSTSVTMDGREFLYFGGTNYLGLSHRPELLEAASAAFETYGFSAGASRLTSGETEVLLALEERLSRFGRAEASLVLPAGYTSNTAVVDALDDEIDCWIIQSQCHASIKSALATSDRRVIVHDIEKHGEPLRKMYDLPSQARLGIFAEAIDPLTGTLFDPRMLLEVAEGRDYLVLDEAHSFGVLGEKGIGALEHFMIQHENLIRTGTFSKGIGTYGGFVLADEKVVNHIKEKSGIYKGSTALSPLASAATIEALALLENDPATTIQALKGNIGFLNRQLVRLGVTQYENNCVPIYYLANSPEVMKLREDLPVRGIYIPTVTSYFADFCEIGLRWTIQAGHTEEQLNMLVNEIEKHLHAKV